MSVKQKTILFAAAMFALFLSAGEKLPVAVGGYYWDGRDIRDNLLLRNQMAVYSPPGPWQVWLPPEEYKKYSVVYIGEQLKGIKAGQGWNTPETVKAVREYMEGGGIIITSGSVPRELLGKKPPAERLALFGFRENGSLPKGETGVSEPGSNRSYPWQDCSLYTAERLSSAIPLLIGNVTKKVLATWNPVGKGGLVWISPGPMRLRELYSKQKKSLGAPDENGVFVFTPEGEALDRLNAFYLKQFQRSPQLKVEIRNGSWGVKPLGKPGSLNLSAEFLHQPVFQKKSGRKPGLTICSEGKTAVIVLPKNSEKPLRALAKELKYHLDLMSGADFPIADQIPQDRAALVFGNADIAVKFGVNYGKLEPGTSVIRRKDNLLLIGGNNSSAVSRALSYLLEAVGCRYLWPGKSGKVIPRRSRIIVPDLELVQAPVLKVRSIRNYSFLAGRWKTSLAKFGMDARELEKELKAASQDHPGNRGFFQWHGVNDEISSTRAETQHVRSAYVWGHAFTDFYQRYGKTHPEFFALQPDGSRKQPARPQLCMSNEKLAETIAGNLIRRFSKEPWRKALSICLNDGGYTSICLCEECRKLDPANGRKISVPLFRPVRRNITYVSITDRVLCFANRIAERVVAKYPDKKLTLYTYAEYANPPKERKPHPALILLSVHGGYTSDLAHAAAVRGIAAWSQFGNPLLWRPNGLWGCRLDPPQNYARAMFNDLELFKANGLIGTDFDCFEQHWANKGLVYYALAKAHWNPDRLDYDTVFSDYCSSGFGPAARPVGKYFELLEKMNTELRAANGKIPYMEIMNEEKITELSALLDEARRLAQQKPEILERIDFLKIGMDYAADCRKVFVAQKNKSPDCKPLRVQFLEKLKQRTKNNPLAVSPLMMGFYSPYMPR